MATTTQHLRVRTPATFLSLLLPLALVLALPATSAAGSSPVTGTATSCGGLASCTWTLTGSSGTGTASTSAAVGGYVGQSPLLFSGGSVTFRLPGEAQATSASGVYNGQAVLDGTSSTAGTLYETTGTFYVTDANTGQVVAGSTDTVIGIKGHSGRGGGIIFTLVSGTITITPTGQDGTSTAVSCYPSSLTSNEGAFTICIVQVTDSNTASPTVPTGTITFSTSGSGTFWSGSTHGASCILRSSGICAVAFFPTVDSGGTMSIYANYLGDSTHYQSTGRGLLYVTPPA